MKCFLNLNKAKRKNGFTLIELMVVIAIFTVVSSFILANYKGFSSRLSLKRTAQEMAVSIREAQAYSISVRAFEGEHPGYGIYFNSASNNTFILFADKPNLPAFPNGNSHYDGLSEKVKEFKIQTSDVISDLCTNAKTNPPGACGFSELEIIYLRPVAFVTIRDNSGIQSDAEIILSSPRGDVKTVVVWPSGYVSTE